MKNKECIHNTRCRYTTGYYCEDCNIFFDKDTQTYRKTELLSNIWCVLHNINVESMRKNNQEIKEIRELLNKIGIHEEKENYEELIAESEIMMKEYNKDSNSATITLEN